MRYRYQYDCSRAVLNEKRELYIFNRSTNLRTLRIIILGELVIQVQTRTMNARNVVLAKDGLQ